MRLVIRTWNLFHGRTSPESRQVYLEHMVRLVTRDGPDLVGLQEVPVWGLRHLPAWSGMRAFGAVTKRALLGPLARYLHELDPIRVRSTLTGQANALLVGAGIEVVSPPRSIVLNPGSRLERRVCQLLAARVAGRPLAVANLHASTDDRAARGELERVGELIGGQDACVVVGDFNVRAAGLPTFSPPGSGIDQILVRALELAEGPSAWPDEQRSVDGRLLSDHAPVEAVIA